MVAQFNLRTYRVTQEFRFDEGIWLHRKSGQIRFFFKYLFLHHACATCFEQPSNIKTMIKSIEKVIKLFTLLFHYSFSEKILKAYFGTSQDPPTERKR